MACRRSTSLLLGPAGDRPGCGALRLPYDANSAGLSVTYQAVVKLVPSEKYCHAGGLLPYWPAGEGIELI